VAQNKGSQTHCCGPFLLETLTVNVSGAIFLSETIEKIKDYVEATWNKIMLFYVVFNPGLRSL
jgi:hypothetical protein